MKRVVLLVLVMVPLMELELERYRLYFYLSTAALAVFVWNLVKSRRKTQRTPTPHSLGTRRGESASLTGTQRERARHSDFGEVTHQGVESTRAARCDL
jgi:hypothetical protein